MQFGFRELEGSERKQNKMKGDEDREEDAVWRRDRWRGE